MNPRMIAIKGIGEIVVVVVDEFLLEDVWTEELELVDEYDVCPVVVWVIVVLVVGAIVNRTVSIEVLLK